MRFKHIDRADVNVSSIAVGTWAIGGEHYGEVNKQDSILAIRKMLDEGVNLIDTAPAYGEGHSEQVVGEAIEGYDRSKIMISTKVGIGKTTARYKRHPSTEMVRDGRYENILYECEQSLRRLGTDYIDFYFIHWPDFNTSIEETMDALNELKKEGKIRFCGVSNFSIEQMEECEKYGRLAVIQPSFSMVARSSLDLIKWAYERGIGIFSYGTLGAGILTGKYRKVPTFEEGDPRGSFYPYFKEPQFSKVMKLIEVMDGVSKRIGKPLSQIALNWTLQKEYISAGLCGVKNERQAIENCKAMDWKLDDDYIVLIDKAIETYLNFDGNAPMKG